MENVKLNDNFTQVCVWPGTIVGEDEVDKFVEWMKECFGVRAQYLEEVKTAPDRDRDGYQVKGTGDRNDVFFAVHDKDVTRFAIPRLEYGIRWIEDVYGNNHGYLYPARIQEYRSW